MACALLGALALLAGCGTEAIKVSQAALTDRPDARVTGWTADEDPRLVFSPEDEAVVIKLLFDLNYRAVYEWYTVEWLAPDGSPYQVVSQRTEFGSHRDLTASLEVRGKMASRLPGLWRVRVWLQGRKDAPDRLLVGRLFRILTPEEAGLEGALTSVDPPAPDRARPLASGAASLAAAGPGAPPEPAAADAGAAPPDAPVPAAGTAASGVSLAAAASPGVLPEGLLLPAFVGAPAVPAGAQAGAPGPGAAPAARAADAPAATPPAAGADTAATPAPGRVTAAPSPAEAGISSISIEARPAPVAPGRRPWYERFEGCPPLYYPPGPGCVEEAPQE